MIFCFPACLLPFRNLLRLAFQACYDLRLALVVPGDSNIPLAFMLSIPTFLIFFFYSHSTRGKKYVKGCTGCDSFIIMTPNNQKTSLKRECLCVFLKMDCKIHPISPFRCHWVSSKESHRRCVLKCLYL